MKKFETKKIAVSAMLTAVAFLVTFCTAMFKVSGFLSLDLKDAVLSMISLMYGPAYGIISVIVVSLIEFVTISTTGVYGLVMNILSSGTFALVCGFVYKYKRSFSGAIFAAVLTTISVTSVMLLANIFITPLYFQMPTQAVIDMLPTVLLPFNLCKTIMNSSIMLLVYKPFTTALKKTGFIKSNDTKTYRFSKKSAVLTVVAIIFLVAAIIILVSLGIEVKTS
jgi:riboflavin transporter FmnP